MSASPSSFSSPTSKSNSPLPTPRTDPVTQRALSRLGYSPEDLEFPNSTDLSTLISERDPAKSARLIKTARREFSRTVHLRRAAVARMRSLILQEDASLRTETRASPKVTPVKGDHRFEVCERHNRQRVTTFIISELRRRAQEILEAERASRVKASREGSAVRLRFAVGEFRRKQRLAFVRQRENESELIAQRHRDEIDFEVLPAAEQISRDTLKRGKALNKDVQKEWEILERRREWVHQRELKSRDAVRKHEEKEEKLKRTLYLSCETRRLEIEKEAEERRARYRPEPLGPTIQSMREDWKDEVKKANERRREEAQRIQERNLISERELEEILQGNGSDVESLQRLALHFGLNFEALVREAEFTHFL
jgi:hypothetical protein